MAVLFGCLLLLSSAFASVERRNTVCYSPFGCFSSDGLLKAPQSPDVVDTYFRLYVRGHSSHINEIGGKAGRVTSDFNKYRLSVYSIYNIIVRFIFRLATKHFASKCTTSKEKHSCCILQLIRWTKTFYRNPSIKLDFAGAGWEREVTTFTNHVSATKKTKVLIHGFINNGRSPWVVQAKNELLKKASLIKNPKKWYALYMLVLNDIVCTCTSIFCGMVCFIMRIAKRWKQGTWYLPCKCNISLL